MHVGHRLFQITDDGSFMMVELRNGCILGKCLTVVGDIVFYAVLQYSDFIFHVFAVFFLNFRLIVYSFHNTMYLL